MMGHREELKGGFEWDAFTGWRRVHNWNPGVRRYIKARFNRRVRREAKEVTKKDAERNTSD